MKTTTSAAELAPLLEADERYQVEVDAFIERNRDALNASLGRARNDVAQGRVTRAPVSEIIAEHRSHRA